VVLKSTKYPNKEPIAYALFMSCDQNAQVGGVALGKEFWKVRVTYPIEENEELVTRKEKQFLDLQFWYSF
jgi:hypothetical protein